MSAQGEENKEGVALWRRWKAGHTMLALTVFTAGVLLAAYRKDPYAMNPIVLVGVSFTIGFFGGTFQARRLSFALSGLILGLAVGILSSLDFFFLPVEGVYFAVLTSLVVYVALGLLVGGFVETVRFLHCVVHGCRPRDYPLRKTEK